MASLSFEGETHGEIVLKVRRWLASLDGKDDDAHLSAAEAVEQAAELTKDALRVVAQAAPGPVGGSDIVKGLTSMGYRVTDSSRDAMIAGLDSVEQLTGGSVLRRVGQARRNARYEMSSAVAKQVLKALKP